MDSSTPGLKADQSPLRSELIGVNSILLVLAILVKHFDIVDGAITIALDCEGTLNRISNGEPLNISMKSFDILQDIRNRLDALPITVHWRWVEDHQLEKGGNGLVGKRNFGVDLAVKSLLKKV